MNDSGCYVEPSSRVRRMARVALCNCCGDPFEAEPQPLPTEGPSSDGDVPPEPEPGVAGTIHERRQPEQAAKTADAAGRSSTEDRTRRSSHPIEVASSSDSSGKSKEPVVKQYDNSHKAPDIIVKASETPSKPNYSPARVDLTPAVSLPGVRRDQGGPRIRWERAAVSIYRFETKEDAVAAMDFVRRKSLGENADEPADSNLKYVTNREVGWTRPQDVRSPELAKILFELPVGHVSPVIEVGDTLLVCRVLERQPPDPVGNSQTPSAANSEGLKEQRE